MSAKRSVILNRRAAIIAGCVALLAVPIGFGLWGFQRDRVRREALSLIRQLEQEQKGDLALRNVGQYLATRPGDVDALEIQARLLDQMAYTPDQKLAAAQVNDRLLRMQAEGPERQATRRRLVKLYIHYGDAVRGSNLARIAPEMAVQELRYGAAKAVAVQLKELEEKAAEAERARKVASKELDEKAAEAEKSKRLAPVYQLYAAALEGLAVPGDEESLTEAIAYFGRAFEGDPKEFEAPLRLAELYRTRKKDQAAAIRVLDELLARNPDPVERPSRDPAAPTVRLIRYRLLVLMHRDAEARKELAAALEFAPDSVEVILAAAGDAIRQGRITVAKRHIEAIAEKDRNDPRVNVLRGLIEFGDERPLDAVQAWQRGLVSSGGTDANQTWWLAYAQLRMGNVQAAQPLIAQYARLAGTDTQPLYRVLKAEEDLHTQRPNRALAHLEWARDKIGEEFLVRLHVALGRAYTQLWDDTKALAVYHKAQEIDPLAVEPYLEASRLVERTNLDNAVAEVQRGLDKVPEDADLLTALARLRLMQQVGRPLAQRDFAEFQRLVDTIYGIRPEMVSQLIVLQANALMLAGKLADAIDMLAKTTEETKFKNEPLVMTWVEALARAGRIDEGMKILERATARECLGERNTLYLARANLLTALNRGREARDLLMTGMERVETQYRAPLWQALGRFQQAQGDLKGARQSFLKWSELTPEDPTPRLALLEMSLNSGDEASARAIVDGLRPPDASKLDPAEKFGADTISAAAARNSGPGDIAWQLCEAYLLIRNYKVAPADARRHDPELKQSLRRAYALVKRTLMDAPEIPTALLLQGEILDLQGKTDDAIESYRHAVRRNADGALYRLISLLTKEHRSDELEQLRRQSANSRFDQLAAQSMLLMGDRDTARRFVAQAAPRESADAPELRRWQARMFGLLGQEDQSEEALRAVAEQRPGDLAPWLMLLMAQSQHGRRKAIETTIARVKASVKTDNPALLEARCYWAAGDRAGAEHAFNAALRDKPDDHDSLILASLYFEEMRNLGEAANCLRRLLVKEPDDRPATRQLAVLMANQAIDVPSWARAYEVLGPEAKDTEPEDRLARGNVLARSPDPARKAQGIAVLEALTADLPKSVAVAVGARALLTRLLLDVGRPDRAREIASVSAIDAVDPGPVILYIEALLADKKWDEAERQLERLAAISPGDAREAAYRTRLIIGRAGPAKAAAALEEAAKGLGTGADAEPFGRQIFAELATLEPPANDPLERVGRLLAGRSAGLSWMPAMALARKGKIDEAVALCLDATRGGSTADLVQTARVAMSFGTARDAGQAASQGADKILQAVLVREPANADILAMTAMFRHRQEQYDEEIRLYREILKRNPGNGVALNNLAWALSEAKQQHSEALVLVDELIDRVGRDAVNLDTRAVILIRLDRHDEAIKDLQQIVTLRPSPAVLYHLALAYHKAGRLDDSRKQLQAARDAGLTPALVDATERTELAALLSRQQ